MTVQELINELLKYPKDKKVYNDDIQETLSGEIVLVHKYTDEEERNIEEQIKLLERKWEQEMERDSIIVTFVDKW